MRGDPGGLIFRVRGSSGFPGLTRLRTALTKGLLGLEGGVRACRFDCYSSS